MQAVDVRDRKHRSLEPQTRDFGTANIKVIGPDYYDNETKLSANETANINLRPHYLTITFMSRLVNYLFCQFMRAN